jgi:integrase
MASGPYFDPRRGSWSIQFYDGVRWCRKVVVKKRRGWKPGDPSPKKPPPEALAELGKYIKIEERAREGSGAGTTRSIEGFLETYRKFFEGVREPSSVKVLDRAIRTFLAWCEEKGYRRLDQLTPSACNQWIVDRTASAQYATIKKERGLLAAAWSRAARLKEIPENPWTAAILEGKPKPEKKGSWTPEQYKKLLEISPPWLKDFFVLGCNTGLRIAALRLLEWRDVEWAKSGAKSFGWIVVRPELDKAGKGYRVPINEAVHELLFGRFLHKDADATFVLTGRRKRGVKGNNITDRAIRRVVRKAGLDSEEKPIKSPNHHCRRTFGRWAIAGHLTGKPVPLYILSRWYGHATVNMTIQYLDVTEDDSTRFMLGEDDGADYVV